jgi:hypothetical protein
VDIPQQVDIKEKNEFTPLGERNIAFHYYSTLAIQESTRCRPGNSEQAPSGN